MTDEPQCWICRSAPANSGEHKYPAAFLRRIPEAWSDLLHGRGEETLHTQGPKSRNLKISVLCKPCNNARTANQDRALDALLLSALDKEKEIWDSRLLVLDHDPLRHDVLDVYRCLLKLEFSRFCEDGLIVPDAVADFVAGGPDWHAVNEIVRIQFRVVENLHHLSIVYPSETPGAYFDEPYFLSNQINFGWLGIHFVWTPGERPDIPWTEWEFDTAQLTPCQMIGLSESVDPLL